MRERKEETALRSRTSTRSYRIAAGIMGVMMLLVLLLSSVLIAHEADHDCCGEDCPVCACVAQCVRMIHRAAGNMAHLSATIVPVLFVLILAVLIGGELKRETLVSTKIRIND